MATICHLIVEFIPSRDALRHLVIKPFIVHHIGLITRYMIHLDNLFISRHLGLHKFNQEMLKKTVGSIFP